MIRDIHESDYQTYVEMSKKFYASDAVASPIPESHFEQTFQLIINNSPLLRGIVYEWDGQICGYALLAFMYSNEFGGIVVLLEEMYIDPQYRGKGIGKELFAYIEREYQSTSKCLRLEVSRSNHKAIELYTSLGYEEWSYMQMVKKFI